MRLNPQGTPSPMFAPPALVAVLVFYFVALLLTS